MNSQSRRRERRADKQAEWKAANPLLVGISAKPETRKILSLTRKVRSRVEAAINPPDLSDLVEYRSQLECHAEKADKLARANHKIWHRDANPFGNKIHAVQKRRGNSTPLI